LSLETDLSTYQLPNLPIYQFPNLPMVQLTNLHPSLLILLISLLYLLGFGALSFMRRQGLSTRFAVEGLIVATIGAVLPFFSVPVNPALFLAVIYLVTMRVRLMVDLGNWLASRGRYGQALDMYQFALRLGPDAVSHQITLINRGVTQLRMQEPEAAYGTLTEALAEEQVRPGAKYLAAGYYNLGLACRRTGREAEAIRHFNEAIDVLPTSIYAHGAKQALKKGKDDKTSEV
jgi:tetratricopeptide (TPR) repeat protein